MYLSALALTQFKNYASARLEFSPRLNCFVGPNGAGKTNLLEAIYFLCMSKGPRSMADQFSIRHGDSVARVEGTFRGLAVHPTGAARGAGREEVQKIVVKLKRRGRKVIERNGTAYTRISEHVGRFPVVIVTPDDVSLVRDGSEQRRRLIDNSLSQTNPMYLNHLLTYNRLVTARNAHLKHLAGRADRDGLLDVFNAQLEPAATYLYEKRKAFAAPFAALLAEAYAAISNGPEEIGLDYRSQLEDTTLAELFAARREKDAVLQRTTGGLHRDDLVFTQDGHPLRRVASQGQLKSFVLALKLAQYRLLREQTQRLPLLLLDDIFDKLDANRVARLLSLVTGEDYGQIFLTDTDPVRVAHLVEGKDEADWKRFMIDQLFPEGGGS